MNSDEAPEVRYWAASNLQYSKDPVVTKEVGLALLRYPKPPAKGPQNLPQVGMVTCLTGRDGGADWLIAAHRRGLIEDSTVARALSRRSEPENVPYAVKLLEHPEAQKYAMTALRKVAPAGVAVRVAREHMSSKDAWVRAEALAMLALHAPTVPEREASLRRMVQLQIPLSEQFHDSMIPEVLQRVQTPLALSLLLEQFKSADSPGMVSRYATAMASYRDPASVRRVDAALRRYPDWLAKVRDARKKLGKLAP